MISEVSESTDFEEAIKTDKVDEIDTFLDESGRKNSCFLFCWVL